MEISRDSGDRAAIGIGLASLLVLFVFILRAGPTLVFDEPYHLETVERLERQGLTVEYLRSAEVASGPLYAVVHAALRPLTHGQAPAIRLVNFGFLLLTMALIWAALRLRGSPRAPEATLSLLAVPAMWVLAGMALTEMPAMTLALAGSLCLLMLPRVAEQGGVKPWLVAVLGGIAVGIAVTGRQPYLVVFCAAPALADRRTWKLVAAFIAAGVVLPGMLFFIWGGISPPPLAVVTEGISISIPNGILALAYAGVMVAIITLRWFSLGWKISALAAALAIAANLALGIIEFTPARLLAERFLPAAALPIYGLLASGILLAFAVLFVLSSLKNLAARRDDRVFLFVCICGGLICLTAMKIKWQFSSRYVAMAMPWLLLSAEYYWEPGKWKAVRMILGAALGFMTLAAYVYFDS